MRKLALSLGAIGLVALVLFASTGNDRPVTTATRAIDPIGGAAAYGPPASTTSSSTWTLAATGFILSGVDGTYVLPVTIPERAFHTVIEVKFQSGAAHTFGFSGLSTCAQRLDGPVLGDGTTVVFDCAGALPGNHEVHFAHRAGHLSGHISILSEVCQERARCPVLPPP